MFCKFEKMCSKIEKMSFICSNVENIRHHYLLLQLFQYRETRPSRASAWPSRAIQGHISGAEVVATAILRPRARPSRALQGHISGAEVAATAILQVNILHHILAMFTGNYSTFVSGLKDTFAMFTAHFC